MRGLMRMFFLAVLLAFPLAAYAGELTDVKQHWAASVIDNLYARQILAGDEQQRFYPNKPVTRAEFVSMLVRGLELTNGESLFATGDMVFTDLPKKHWAYENVQIAYRNGLISGDEYGRVHPNSPLTREEAAVIMARAEYKEVVEQKINNAKALTFKDANKISKWAKTGVALASARGIVNGENSGRFNPSGTTTKAEAATMLFNYLNGNSSKRGLAVLMYHHVAPPGTYAKPNGATITTTQFEAQMRALSQYGYTAISTRELYDYLTYGKALPKQPVLITFDDGYESNYVYAYPILKKHGHKAVINIVVGATPNTNQGDRGEQFDPTYMTHLTWKQMQEMVASGLIEIASHTYDSHDLIIINSQGKTGPALVNKMWLTKEKRLETEAEYRKRIAADLGRAKETIEANLPTTVTTFCYPYGRFNTVTENVTKSLGYKVTLTTKYGHVTAEHSPRLLYRIKVGPEDTLADFLAKI